MTGKGALVLLDTFDGRRSWRGARDVTCNGEGGTAYLAAYVHILVIISANLALSQSKERFTY